ncbi:hypothetical protein J5N97_015556 [Dioscorea zingiberensis]|uniref:Uncharacterized protein n=1 Tax=Dioscorea zingiberensis TaxID=325984 RepID=A0A9D5HEC5_9LILI|nr:hypothetical protein J5N97_015556 [Dioscorea zingiberensis]
MSQLTDSKLSEFITKLNEAGDLVHKGLTMLDEVGEAFLILQQERINLKEESAKQPMAGEKSSTPPGAEEKSITPPGEKQEEKEKANDEEIHHKFIQVAHKFIAGTSDMEIDTPSTDNYSASYLNEYSRISKIAYSIRNSEKCRTNHAGIYPRLTMLPNVNPEVVAEMFKYGYIQTIYPSSNLQELTYLPSEVKEAVRLFREGTKTTADIYLQVLSAGPDWEGDEFFPAQHLIQIGISKPREPMKNLWYQKYPDNLNKAYVEDRRISGLKAIYDRHTAILSNRNTWTYPFSPSIAVISIGNRTMNVASIGKIRNELLRISTNSIPSSQESKKKLCKLLKHDNTKCGPCHISNTNPQEKEDIEAPILL